MNEGISSPPGKICFRYTGRTFLMFVFWSRISQILTCRLKHDTHARSLQPYYVSLTFDLANVRDRMVGNADKVLLDFMWDRLLADADAGFAQRIVIHTDRSNLPQSLDFGGSSNQPMLSKLFLERNLM